jgi:hypothetical protein
VFSERLYQPAVLLLAPEFGVQGAGVHHVVTVRTAGSSFQIRRGIQVADPQLRQVRHQLCHIR